MHWIALQPQPEHAQANCPQRLAPELADEWGASWPGGRCSSPRGWRELKMPWYWRCRPAQRLWAEGEQFR